MRILVIDDDREGSILLDSDSRHATVDGRRVRLTRIEWLLLSELIKARGGVVSKRELISSAWGGPGMATDEALKQRICSLRRKVGRDRIDCVSGEGYRYAE